MTVSLTVMMLDLYSSLIAAVLINVFILFVAYILLESFLDQKSLNFSDTTDAARNRLDSTPREQTRLA